MDKYKANFLKYLRKLGYILVFVPVSVYAAAQEPFQTVYIIKLIFGLICVITIIFLFSWLYRKFGVMGLPARGALQIESMLSLGSKEKVVVVRCDRHRLLLGVSAGKVETLLVLDDVSEEQLSDDSKIKPAANVHALFNALTRTKDQGKPECGA